MTHSGVPQPLTKNIRHHVEDARGDPGHGPPELAADRPGDPGLRECGGPLCGPRADGLPSRRRACWSSSRRGDRSALRGGDPFQRLQEPDSLSTHMLIIRSPAIVERAITMAGIDQLSVDGVIARFDGQAANRGSQGP